jgi:hypothetical protein
MTRVVVDLFFRSLLCFGVAAAVYGLVSPNEAEHVACGVQAAPAQFGVVDGTGRFTETEVVPLVIGQEFGWRMPVGEGTHVWREVLVAPAAPREWIGDDLQIENNGLVGVTERTEVARNGLIEHGWIITEGDPAGPYEMQLFVDDKHVSTFRFVLR